MSTKSFPATLNEVQFAKRELQCLVPSHEGEPHAEVNLYGDRFPLQPRARESLTTISDTKVKVHLLLFSSILKFCANLQAGNMIEFSLGISLKTYSPSRLPWTLQSQGISLGGTTGQSVDL